MVFNLTATVPVLLLQKGETALIVASIGGHVECVKLLLDTGASADLSDKVSTVSHQVLSVLHVPLCKYCVVEVNSVYLYIMSCK